MNSLTFANNCKVGIKNSYLAGNPEEVYLQKNFNIINKCNVLFLHESENNRRSLLNRYLRNSSRPTKIKTNN